MQIIISELSIEVIKKNIKNLHLSVLPPNGHVRISAPMSMSEESIKMFARTKIGWIRKQQQKFENQPRQDKREFITGETLYVLGKQYFLVVNYSYKGNSLKLNGNQAFLTVRKESTAEQRENYVNEWYRAILKLEILKLLPKWEKMTGLFCNNWQTKNMSTRWGTCNVITKKIWLNLQLAKKPIQCLEYVILHELAHLKEKNHGKEFIAILDEFMPYWREVKKQLNDSKLDFME